MERDGFGGGFGRAFTAWGLGLFLGLLVVSLLSRAAVGAALRLTR